MPSLRVVAASRAALRAVEGQRDVRVADQGDAEVGARRSTARRSGPESTYSQIGSRGEAWKSPTPPAAPCGLSESRNSRVSGAITSRVQRGRERRAARELLEREHVDDRQVVVAGQADACSARGRARRRRPARRRSRRGRRGTTAPRRPRPRRPRSPPRRRGGCRGCRMRWRPALRRIVYSVPVRLRLPVAIVAALVVAEAAVLLMRPRRSARARSTSRREPTSARRRSRRPRHFRNGQLVLYAAQIGHRARACSSFVVMRPPRVLLARRPRPCSRARRPPPRCRSASTVATLPAAR